MEKSELLAKEKEVVVPGEILAKGLEYLPSYGTYREGDAILASKLGVVNVDGKVIKLISLKGRYMPKRNDVIIGQVTEILLGGWRVELNCAYEAMLNVKDATSDFIQKGADLRQYFDIGDYMMAAIVNVTSQKLVDLSLKGPGLRRLENGRIISINTHKVPRIIGKGGSMISMVKNATGCRILVGQNGTVWINGAPDKELLAVEAIQKIEREAHVDGLTEKMKLWLEEKTGMKITDSPRGEQQPQPEQSGNNQNC
jgi:exosome complex component RRP4